MGLSHTSSFLLYFMLGFVAEFGRLISRSTHFCLMFSHDTLMCYIQNLIHQPPHVLDFLDLTLEKFLNSHCRTWIKNLSSNATVPKKNIFFFWFVLRIPFQWENLSWHFFVREFVFNFFSYQRYGFLVAFSPMISEVMLKKLFFRCLLFLFPVFYFWFNMVALLLSDLSMSAFSPLDCCSCYLCMLMFFISPHRLVSYNVLYISEG